MARPQLMKGEEVFREVHPHWLGMYKLYVIWAYLVAISVLFMAKRAEWIPAFQKKFGFFATANAAYLTLWISALVIPAIVIAVARISLRWLLVVVMAGGLGIYLKEFTLLGVRDSPMFVDNIANVTILALGALGIVGTEMYRRCHSYIVTNRRIIVAYTGLGSSERSLLYSKVDDLILHKPILGKILGFGSIIPLTSSGIGTGSESAGGGLLVGGKIFGANFGVGVGGAHSRNIPEESITYTLFNVPDPETVYQHIIGQMSQRETQP